MDSSRDDIVTADVEWTPWRVRRLSLRLDRYRTARKHGWERIATDILYLDELPEAYVDKEDTRPLSESLRRLANGSQVPSNERLYAVFLFLRKEGFIADSDLQDDDIKRAAPMAFSEFAAIGIENFDHVRDRWRKLLVGHFQKEGRDEHTFYIERLDIGLDGDIETVSLTTRKYEDPHRELTAKNVSRRARHKVRGENRYAGWLALLSPYQAIAMMKGTLYEGDTTCWLLYAAEQKDEDAATKVIILPYQKMLVFEDFSAAPFMVDEKELTVRVEDLFKSTLQNGLRTFERRAD